MLRREGEERQGTLLPNVHTIVFPDESVMSVTSVYVWPNGYVTAYRDNDTNKGTIYPPHMIGRLIFGEKK